MSMVSQVEPRVATQIPEPPIAKFLFADTRMGIVWLIIRLYAGYEWFTAGLDKLTGRVWTFGSSFNTPAKGGSWIFTNNLGSGIKGFAQGAVAKATGTNPPVQDWYANFLQAFVIPNAGLWAYLITFGELAVGLGLIFGVLTGIAAFFGLVMNFNYLLAGTVSTNPILGFIGILLVLAWRVAGYYGVDRYLLPALGTPWTGSLIGKTVGAFGQKPSKPAATA